MEQDRLLEKLANDGKSGKIAFSAVQVQGNGLHQSWETTMDYNNRTLIQITIDDAAAADETSPYLWRQAAAKKEIYRRNAQLAELDI